MSQEPEGVTYVAYGGEWPYGWGKGATLQQAVEVAKSHGCGTKRDYTVICVHCPDSEEIEVEIRPAHDAFLLYTPDGVRFEKIQASRKEARK